MDEKSITQCLREGANGAEFINREQIKRVRGCGDNTVNEYTEGLPFLRHNRTKWYSVRDVAHRMMEFVEY